MFFIRLLLATAATLPLSAALSGPIKVESGQLSGVPGTNVSDVQVYKGIPFAAPPVGDLRWRPPQPPSKWDGIRAADKFSANCMQRQANGGAFPPGGGDRTATQMSEDCLYLNVYTAASSASEKRPVMVWIHGGALVSGAGAIYEGEELAHRGAVLVTINYRLGAFGFFAHPELTKESPHHASGNYGLLDQVAALEWVKKNIAAFGGDPRRVTIFGESAGSWSVNFQTASPLAKGLFQRAIGESGAEFAPFKTLAEAEEAGAKFAKSVNADSLAALRALPAADLNKQNGYIGPDVDGWFLPEDVYTIFAKGKQNDVPTMIGSNQDEGTLFTPASVTGASFKEASEKRYGTDTDAFLKLYPYSNDTEARAAQAASMRDYTFGWEMRTWARLQTKTGKNKVYVYYFSRVQPGPSGARLGSQHGAEIAYAFDWVNEKGALPEWQDLDRKLSQTVSTYWLNFAATGNPNGKGEPEWPAWKTPQDQVMSFGDKVEVKTLPNKPSLDFLDSYFERVRKAGAPMP